MRPARSNGRHGSYSMTRELTRTSPLAAHGPAERVRVDAPADAAPAPAPAAAAAKAAAPSERRWDADVESELEGCDKDLMQQFGAPGARGGAAAQKYPVRKRWAKPVVPEPVATQAKAVGTNAAAMRAVGAGNDIDRTMAAIKAQAATKDKPEDQAWFRQSQATALIDAARRGQLDHVRKSLNTGADANCTDKTGRTPLIRAAGEGYIEIVQVLIQHQADVNATGDCRSPLTEAVTHNHTVRRRRRLCVRSPVPS